MLDYGVQLVGLVNDEGGRGLARVYGSNLRSYRNLKMLYDPRALFCIVAMMKLELSALNVVPASLISLFATPMTGTSWQKLAYLSF